MSTNTPASGDAPQTAPAQAGADQATPAVTWAFLLRVLLKAAILFSLCNASFALLTPLEALGRLSLYNSLLPGRQRLPYGENPDESYNISLNNLPAMMASHAISRPKAADEYRVLLIGDSATWGWFQENEATLAGQLNAGKRLTKDGRRLVAYNLGYPIMSLTKDLLLLAAARQYEPDLIVWPVTLESFPRAKQLAPPLLQHNAGRVRDLIERYGLDLDGADERFVKPAFLDRTLVGQRRSLADLLRLQLYGFAWAATGIDQAIPQEITLRQSDFDQDISWSGYEQPAPLTEAELAFDVLAAGEALAADIPLLLINEPIFVSDGQNSDRRYNAWYPRWAYDEYRQLLSAVAAKAGWQYLDLWDSIAPQEFSDSPVHLTPRGTARLAELVSAAILQSANRESDE